MSPDGAAQIRLRSEILHRPAHRFAGKLPFQRIPERDALSAEGQRPINKSALGELGISRLGSDEKPILRKFA